MKKLIMLVVMLVVMVFGATSAMAEASFDQIQTLIKNQDYAAAVKGLEVIIQNHPKSAKAFYAMSQAQAGIGNQTKAKEALDMAKGLDPDLKFAPSSNVEKLQEAIQPQTKNIVAIESHTGRNILIVLFLLGGGIGLYFFLRKKEEDEPVIEKRQEYKPEPERETYRTASAPSSVNREPAHYATTNHRGYVPPAPAPRPYYGAPVAPVAPTQPTTIINNNGGNNGGNDLVTGMVLGAVANEVLSDHHHSHDTYVDREVVVEREPVYVDREVPTRDNSWDRDETPSRSSSWDTPSETKSSSWDDTPSKSSSWDDDSSSRSSSWDSDSSSSDSSGSDW